LPPDLSSESSTYSHDPENEHVFFYHDNFEVDFYIPDAELAIQVSYSLREEDTRKRWNRSSSETPSPSALLPSDHPYLRWRRNHHRSAWHHRSHPCLEVVTEQIIKGL